MKAPLLVTGVPLDELGAFPELADSVYSRAWDGNKAREARSRKMTCPDEPNGPSGWLCCGYARQSSWRRGVRVDRATSGLRESEA